MGIGVVVCIYVVIYVSIAAFSPKITPGGRIDTPAKALLLRNLLMAYCYFIAEFFGEIDASTGQHQPGRPDLPAGTLLSEK